MVYETDQGTRTSRLSDEEAQYVPLSMLFVSLLLDDVDYKALDIDEGRVKVTHVSLGSLHMFY